MLLTIHDANLKKVAFIDNDKQETLNYYDDTWTRSLETGSSTFEFTVYKKAIKSDTAINKTYNLLNERAFVSFRYLGKSYVFNVMTVEENEQTIKCYCENLNLELINEYANPYKATKAMSFIEYCNAMDLLNFTHLSVGINEISDQKRTLEWDGQDTKLARLLSLAKKFDAEIDFDTQLNADSSIKSFKVNVYHENDDKHQGVGRVRNDIQLTYGKNLKSITRKIDKTGVYNAIRPTGKRTVKNGKGEEVEEIVTIGSLGGWSENNKDGVREFYQQGDMLYAPLSMQMYPSTFTSSTTNDQWIRKDMEVDSDSPSVIRASAIANLRKNAYPALTYEVDGFIDVEIGDTIRIYDDGFTPVLLVQARVSHQKISFTNPASNQTTFSNFKALENNLSDGIQAAFERLFEASKPYLIKLSTDNGVIFKNQIGQSIVTPTLYKGGKPVVSGVTWRWSLDGNTTTGMTYLVQGSSVTDTATLTVAAYIGNDEVAVDEISFVNVLDGTMGTPGKPGQDGRTPYVHFAYAESADGRIGFSTTQTGNKRYIGTYTDYVQTDSTEPTKYKWVDMVGTVSSGSNNLLPNADFSKLHDTTTVFTVAGVTYHNTILKNWNNFYNSGIANPTTSMHSYLTDKIVAGEQVVVFDESDGSRNWKSINTNIDSKKLRAGEYYFSADLMTTLIGSKLFFGFYYTKKGGGQNFHAGQATVYPTAANTWQRLGAVVKINDDIDLSVASHRFYIYGYGFTSNTILYLKKPKLTEGNVMSDFSLSVEDVNEYINSKADQVLTQEQLNALNEKNQILEAEMQAKASMDAFSDLEKAYQSFVKANADSQAKAEADLAEAGRRIDLLVTQFGGFKELKTFIDTYMSSSNEGLIIGKNDASSTIKVSSDRISMFSAGKEVMYISQGVIHIDNGIFTASVQIGKFRTEQYHLNADMNVIRYVG
ncbi:TPA: phage tail protein [Streptococcus suis]|uniref:phage tail spike protein n=1 Tax=Streptococcus suis TaxID=1307 RepID=UPI00209AAD30|nr:phage tail spike protein [Streptococcus suis]MCO8207672.1 phage tail protein [Streptococcus suis]MCO8212025.1 phage tail protein [Streptococcus suis]HEM3492169.1 phage tail protein [Streptococcus suis]HEM3494460.1 phage tail protein [Streptococcus suis]